MTQAILTIVAAQVRQRLGRVVEVEPEDHIFDDLNLDSLDRVEICLACEEEFHLPREIHEGPIFTVQHLIDAVEKARKEKV